MSLVVGTNTYISETDADEYFATRYNSSAWIALDSATKETLLVSATRAVDYFCEYSGEKFDENQELQFPRYPNSEIPEEIKIAQCEIALTIFESNSPIEEIDSNITELKVDVITLKFGDNSNTSTLYNSLVETILSKYCFAYNSSKLIRV